MQGQTKNIASTQTNKLSVQVSLNGLSFLAIDTERRETLFFSEKKLSHSTTPEELLMEIEDHISKNEILDQNFPEVALVYSTPVYGLVPSALFDESKGVEYLKFNSKLLAN